HERCMRPMGRTVERRAGADGVLERSLRLVQFGIGGIEVAEGTVIVRVVADRMAAGDELFGDIRTLYNGLANFEERASDTVGFKDARDLQRERRIRAIVEGERDFVSRAGTVAVHRAEPLDRWRR